MQYIRRTPGVYVTELAAFPPSIVGISTAVPAFIGYTRTATISGKPVFMKPIRIGSLADFDAIFGGEYDPIYTLVEVTSDVDKANHNYDFRVFEPPVLPAPGKWRYFNLTRPAGETTIPRFNLYNSMRLFYANGGGNCYVVSVGAYKKDDGNFNVVDLTNLTDGLTAIGEQVGPTMLVIPEAILLPKTDNAAPLYKSVAYQTLVRAMMQQCFDLKDRVALLDPYGTQYINQVIPNQAPVTLANVVDQFREDVEVPSENRSYGISYFPFLDTTVVPLSDFDYTNISPLTDVNPLVPTLTQILTWENTNLNPDPARNALVQNDINKMKDTVSPTATPPEIKTLNQNLLASLPLLGDIEGIIVAKSERLPSSPAMAGVYTLVDSTRGVWNAPANLSLTAVKQTTFNLNNEQQGDLNLPVNGKAINAIREFVGRGSVVWGARTLDGNSNDYRYIQVRRTLIYIEQTIKASLNTFVFAPNDGNTWVTVTSMISNFLQGVWSAGGLMGASASDAFTVQCGLGSTMTGLDILNGYMVVQVTLQMIHPAEFIELTFKQKMEGVG